MTAEGGGDRPGFETAAGDPIPAVTAGGMREVDRVAVEEVGPGLLRMMENAGRNPAGNVRPSPTAPWRCSRAGEGTAGRRASPSSPTGR